LRLPACHLFIPSDTPLRVHAGTVQPTGKDPTEDTYPAVSTTFSYGLLPARDHKGAAGAEPHSNPRKPVLNEVGRILRMPCKYTPLPVPPRAARSAIPRGMKGLRTHWP